MSAADSILQTIFGFSAFRPGQAHVVNTLLEGKNILAVMPTGAGKSLCYQVPALMMESPTVVISPLVALMDNQVAGLRENGVKVACLHSGQSREENIDQWRRVTHGDAKLLYMSPERLMTDRMLSAMRALKPAMFVVDEAHCVSKWGPAFRPEYADLSRLKDLFPQARIAAFTATADEATRRDIANCLLKGKGEIMVQGFDRPNLSLAVIPKNNKQKQLLAFIRGTVDQSGIIYCLSRKNVEDTAAFLRGQGVKAIGYHAGMSPELRFQNQERFMAETGIVMVATIAFGMGIDKPDIRFVLHMNLPSSMEAFYQEIGRAGRDGQPAATVLIYGLDDIGKRRRFIQNDGSEADHKIREHKRLDALLSYCEASICRRQVLLAYFGETAQACGNCDNCHNPPIVIDETAMAKILLSAIEQTGQRFGAAHIIDILRGADTARIKQFNHDKVAAYNSATTGTKHSKPYLQAFIRQAIAAQLIAVDIARYGALTIGEAGQRVMAGTQTFHCKDISITLQTENSAVEKLPSNLKPEDEVIMRRLKALRKEFAVKIQKPAFVVFSDATLIDMINNRPTNKAEMLNVSGVGVKKLERYGDAFLEVLSKD